MMFSPTLAVELDNDVNAAIFMQQLHFWLSVSRNTHEGRNWVYNTHEQWANKVMRGLVSVTTVRSIIKKLKERNLIQVAQLSANHSDRTCYYTINYQELAKIDQKYSQPTDFNHVSKTDISKCQKPTDACVKNQQMDVSYSDTCLQKNTTEDKQHNITDDQFSEFWKTVPNKDGKKSAEKAFKTAIKKTNLENLIAAYKAYINLCEKQQRFRKNPSTWLNGECWNDESIQAELKKPTTPEKQDSQDKPFTFKLPEKPKGFLGDNQ